MCPSGDIALRWLPLNLAMEIIFGVGNGLLTPINTPLPQPRLTPINVTIWHLNATLSLLVASGYHSPVSVRKSSAMKYSIPVCVLWYIGAERKWPPFCRRILNFSPWTKFVVFWFECYWNLFPEVQLPIGQYWFRQLLGAYQATSFFIWTIDGLSQWRKYAPLGLRVLMCWHDRSVYVYVSNFLLHV